MNTFLNTLFVFCFITLTGTLISQEDEQSISPHSTSTIIPIDTDRPITVSCSNKDGNIEVKCHDKPFVEIIIPSFRPHDSDYNRARFDYDPTELSLKIKLYNELNESNIILHLPCNSNLKLKNIDGYVHVQGITGEINAKTTDGNLRLQDVSGPITAESKDGNIYLKVHPTNTIQPMAIATVDGNITLSLPVTADIEVDAATLDGDFQCDVNFQGTKFKNKGDSSYVKATLNNGGSRITLKTIDGEIYIKESKTNSR